MNTSQVKNFHQSQMIEQVKSTYSPPEKTLKKQIKTIDDQGKKHKKGFRAF